MPMEEIRPRFSLQPLETQRDINSVLSRRLFTSNNCDIEALRIVVVELLLNQDFWMDRCRVPLHLGALSLLAIGVLMGAQSLGMFTKKLEDLSILEGAGVASGALFMLLGVIVSSMTESYINRDLESRVEECLDYIVSKGFVPKWDSVLMSTGARSRLFPFASRPADGSAVGPGPNETYALVPKRGPAS